LCVDDDDVDGTLEDPDRLPRAELDELLERELQREHALATATAPHPGGPTAAWVAE